MKSIVVVEDEVITAMDIQSRLEAMGYNVPAVSMTGEDAIQIAESIRPDLMLMDIMLKGEMDGTVAAREINKKYNIPIVFLTAYDDRKTFNRAKESNPFAYLSKPFGTTELSNAIELALYKNEMIMEVANQKNKYHAVVEHAKLGIILHDAMGTIYEANESSEHIFGTQRSGLIGRNIKEYIPQDELEYMDLKLKTLRPGDTVDISVRHIMQSNGTIKDVDLVATCVNINEQKLLYALINDITEKNKLISRTIFDEKLSTLGKLSAGIIHEINNPLTAVLINLDSANDTIQKKLRAGANGDTKELGELVGQASYGAKRIKNIVGDLREFGRKEVDVDLKSLHEIIASAINISTPQFKNHAQLFTKIAADTRELLLNAGKLEQVLVNLIINASQSFADEKRYDENNINISTELNKLTLQIQISDTGQGIPATNLKGIFEPFYTTKPRGVGTGLGLAICKQIIHSLGGDISVVSSPGVSTTFTIKLPVKLKIEKPCLSESTDNGVFNKIILVVDDDPVSLEIIKRILGQNNKIMTALSGKEALKIIAKSPDIFDIIISDLNMPDINGDDLYMYVKLNNEDLSKKIIFLTGRLSDEMHKFTTRERIPYLEKPYTPEQLINMIKKR